jgi:hypothetical protein
MKPVSSSRQDSSSGATENATSVSPSVPKKRKYNKHWKESRKQYNYGTGISTIELTE